MQTDEMKYVLYLSVNQANGKKYVGFTGRGLERRKKQHEQAARLGKQSYFWNAIRKHNKSAFRWYVIGWSADLEDIKAQEVTHIKFYKALGEELYNMTDGGDGATSLMPEARAKISAQSRINGKKAAESGHMARMSELPQTKAAKQANGRRHAESGHMARMSELPQTKAAQRVVGRALGRRNVENGQLARIRELPQMKIARHKLLKSGHYARIASISGRASVESGRLARIRELPQTKAAQRVVGRRHAESGHCARIAALGGPIGNHNRWHTRRNIVKLDCRFCNPNSAQISTQAVAA